jgi:competence protein ComEC
MHFRVAPWSKTPFIRLLIPFMAGIISQWYFPLQFPVILLVFTFSIFLFSGYFLLPLGIKFLLKEINGFIVHLLFFLSGALLLFLHSKGEGPQLKNRSLPKTLYRAIVVEPPVEKPNSIKTLVKLSDTRGDLKGSEKAIIYFKKNSKAQNLAYGSEFIFEKQLQPVRNTGNPGSFDYKKYCFFNGIYYQSFLADHEFSISLQKSSNAFSTFIFHSRDKVLSIIKTYIPNPKEQGLAEALLIGYKNDLDKDLVQAYSNTGVIHVIAISGLHLGLIYGILVGLTFPLKMKVENALELFCKEIENS